MKDEFEEIAEDIAIWATGGVHEFIDDREIVLDAWTVEIRDALRTQYLAGLEKCIEISENIYGGKGKWGSENSGRYQIQDETCEKIASAIRQEIECVKGEK